MTGAAPSGHLYLLRHGQTEWSVSGRHTGVSDIPLTAEGQQQAARLRANLAGMSFALVATSTRQRARRTAQLAGLAADVRDADRPDTGHGPRATVKSNVVWEDLAEWNYGEYEGITTAEIRKTVPGWTVWSSPTPGGETAAQVGERADAVIARAWPYLDQGDVVFVGHGHMLRVVVARWLGLEPTSGSLFVLDAGGLSELGFEHDTPALLRLNEPA